MQRFILCSKSYYFARLYFLLFNFIGSVITSYYEENLISNYISIYHDIIHKFKIENIQLFIQNKNLNTTFKLWYIANNSRVSFSVSNELDMSFFHVTI